MNRPSPMPTACLYAVKLFAADASGRIAGRLEHVLSGRLHDFDDGAALLAFLAGEQSQAYSNDPSANPSNPGSDAS